MSRRNRFHAGILAIALAPLGCSYCQDCPDRTGPVQQAENYSDYYDAPRVNSASSVPMGPATVEMQGEVHQGEPLPAYQE